MSKQSPRQHLVPAAITLLRTIEADVFSHEAQFEFKDEGAIQLTPFGEQTVAVPDRVSLSRITAWLLGEILAQHRPQRSS